MLVMENFKIQWEFIVKVTYPNFDQNTNAID